MFKTAKSIKLDPQTGVHTVAQILALWTKPLQLAAWLLLAAYRLELINAKSNSWLEAL